MSSWKSAKAKRVLAALERIGWRVKRQKGSHKVLEREISNAGHLPPVLIKNGVKGELNHSGLPLGMFCETEFSVNKVSLNSGDSLLLFTDGVTETVNDAGTEFGTKRLFGAINGGGFASPGELITHCVGHVNEFRGNAHRHDDLTMLALSFV